MSDESASLPQWVRRRDGSQVPFDADCICQSLFTAAESLGMTSAFLTRELTDVVLHFLAKDPFVGIPRSAEIAEQVEKVVREVGQPLLARRYAELQKQPGVRTDSSERRIAIACTGSPEQFVKDCLNAYSRQAVFSRDVAAALEESLLHVDGIDTPACLTNLVLDSPQLAEVDWWLALENWRMCGGERWIVESPEWLCTGQAHPALTPHLCERLLALPTLAQREVELHLNIAEPPAWSVVHPARPLFNADVEEATQQERSNFLDGFLERWKSFDAPKAPAIAWHLHERSFHDENERRQLSDLLRQALQGKAVRFVFDRPRSAIVFAEGLDRRCPGVLLEVGLDLSVFANCPEIGKDGATLLQKLPSLAHIAVSAAAQKRKFLRSLPDRSALKRRFLIDRAAAVVVALGLDDAVRSITGECMTRSPLSLDFARQILQTLKDAMQSAGRAIHLDFRLECGAMPTAAGALPLLKQLEIAGKLHATSAGTATLSLTDEKQADIELLRSAWASPIARLRVQRVGMTLQQGELPI